MLRTANIIGSGSNGLAAAIAPALAVGQVPDFVLGLLSVVGFLLLLFLIFFLIGIPGRRRKRRLDSSQVFGQAYVHNVVAENTLSRGPRFVRYEVTITVPGKPPYEAAKSVVVTPLDYPPGAIGSTYPVKVDPQDPLHFSFLKDDRADGIS